VTSRLAASKDPTCPSCRGALVDAWKLRREIHDRRDEADLSKARVVALMNELSSIVGREVLAGTPQERPIESIHDRYVEGLLRETGRTQGVRESVVREMGVRQWGFSAFRRRGLRPLG
jgi:hypothetical protein